MSRLTMGRLLIFVLVIDVLLIGAFIFIKTDTNTIIEPELDKQEANTSRQISESSIIRICELATLDCFFHNVTEWSFTGDLTHAGKTIWMEYDGNIRAGINGSQVTISDPDENGVVTVAIPSPVVLSKDLDENTIYEIDKEDELWSFLPVHAKITAEDRREALAKAQSEMESGASKNEMILGMAKERAKKIIEKNIVALGDAAGKHYTVKFVDASAVQ